MTDDSNDNQLQITEYAEPSQDTGHAECPVCGTEQNTNEHLTDCHPTNRIDEERSAGVTATTDTATRFRYPDPLHPAVRNVCEKVEAAIREANQHDVVDRATDAIANDVTTTPIEPPAMALFTNLVYLQEHRVLPGYPASAPTQAQHGVSLQEFCSQHPRFDGLVTDTDIEESPYVTTERVYRAVVYRTTTEFVETAPHLPDDGQWAWKTEATPPTQDGLTSAIFGDGTAHNTIAMHARNWLATHPSIDWTVAPHVLGGQRDDEQSNGGVFGASRIAPPAEDAAVLDFAGFTDTPDPRLLAGGIVIHNDPPREIYNAIERLTATHAAILLVFASREEIIQYITYAVEHDWYDADPSPVGNVAEYYSRKPSISTINDDFTAQNFDDTTVRFLTRKQLLDGIVDPEAVLPTLTTTGEA